MVSIIMHIMLSVAFFIDMLNIIMLIVVMLTIILLNVIILSVVAPHGHLAMYLIVILYLIKGLFATFGINDAQHDNTLPFC